MFCCLNNLLGQSLKIFQIKPSTYPKRLNFVPTKETLPDTAG